MVIHRGTQILARRGVGAEPGIDPRRADADEEFGRIRQQGVIEVADYSAVRSSFRRMANHEFVGLMGDPTASAREPWVRVRWINIGGMNWDVIKAVFIKHDLHPLALENVLRVHARARSKADYYPRHLFLRVLCHELGEEDGVEADSNPTFDPSLLKPPLSDVVGAEKTLPGSVGSTLPTFRAMAAGINLEEQRRIQDAALHALKRGERVNVNVSPMFIFMSRDGTVISIHETPTLEMTKPIMSRLRQFDSGLRASADSSMLVQSLLSLIADKALEVVDAYKDKITKFERKVMLRPTIGTVRNLHILSEDLILHRRTLAPIKSVVYALRRYDVDRTAVLDISAAGTKVEGFMSRNHISNSGCVRPNGVCPYPARSNCWDRAESRRLYVQYHLV